MSGCTGKTTLHFDARTVMADYVGGRHKKVVDAFFAVLDALVENEYADLNFTQKQWLDHFVKVFLDIFTEPDLVLTDAQITRFIRLSTVISNLVYLSSWETTDPWVQFLLGQPNNAAKIFTLYSARNKVRIDRKRILNASPDVGSLWYCVYAHLYRSGLVSRTVCENLHEHYTFADVRLMPGHDAQELYFGSSYVPEGGDRQIKAAVNRLIQKAGVPKFDLKPDMAKVAVLSSMWRPGHSVYRTCVDYVRALKGHYHLTLVKFGDDAADETDFNEVVQFDYKDGRFNHEVFKGARFAVAYYPDIGMSPHSIVMANARIAPVQIMGTGHPISCFDGSQIDYFLTGSETEAPDAEKEYSEKLLRMSGMGAIHFKPQYERTGKRHKDDGRVWIACPAAAQKINHRVMSAWQEVIKRSREPLVFRMFVGGALRRNLDHLAFVKAVEAALGRKHVEVMTGWNYEAYMAGLEECDFAVDSFPFGGSNVVNDCLAVGIPIVCVDSWRWPGRIGPAMLRRAGVGYLAMSTELDYVLECASLVNFKERRVQFRKEVEAADLMHLYSKAEAAEFKEAVDRLVEGIG